MHVEVDCVKCRQRAEANGQLATDSSDGTVVPLQFGEPRAGGSRLAVGWPVDHLRSLRFSRVHVKPSLSG